MKIEELIVILQQRFEENKHRHPNIKWEDVLESLATHPLKINSLIKMEETGGEPDVVGIDILTESFIFMDCCRETPVGRRNTCYTLEGELARNKKKIYPNGNVESMVEEMDANLLNQDDYHYLQAIEDFDLKTSSWLETPQEILDLGGSIFGDKRYNHTFIYHNGSASFYSSRGFRVKVLV